MSCSGTFFTPKRWEECGQISLALREALRKEKTDLSRRAAEQASESAETEGTSKLGLTGVDYEWDSSLPNLEAAICGLPLGVARSSLLTQVRLTSGFTG